MATIHELTTTQLRQALQLREQIETLQSKLVSLLGGTGSAASKATPATRQPKARRTMSAAGRAKIAAAQKARWAKLNSKATPAKTTAKAAPTKKAKFSPERRAKLAAAMKARWEVRKKAAAGSAK